DVEIVGATAHLVQHHEMVGHMVLDRRVEAQRHVGAPDQPVRRPRIAAGEQGYIVSLTDEFLGQIRNDPLGAAVQARRAALGARGDLGNLHRQSPPRLSEASTMRGGRSGRTRPPLAALEWRIDPRPRDDRSPDWPATVAVHLARARPRLFTAAGTDSPGQGFY